MTLDPQISAILNAHLRPAGEFIRGFADLSGLVDKQFGEFRYGITIGRRLDPSIIREVVNGPTLEYYSHYRAMNESLSGITQSIAEELDQIGVKTIRISPSVTTEELNTIYHETLRTALSHKMVATRAGLGWIGKTALFISKRFGPRLRLVTLLTTYPLPQTQKPIKTSRCGRCNLCVEACPAQAANGKLWDTSTDRDQFFDARLCRNQCQKFGDTFNQHIRICGICVAVCPVGRP